MPDRKKVIQGLTVCTDDSTFEDCRKCPYHGDDHCTDTVMMEALALLREQGPVPFDEIGYQPVCGVCHETLDVTDNYCRHCGRKVKWKNGC